MKKTRKGLRLFPPEAPMVWEVGWKIGRRIRKAAQGEGTGAGGAVRAHLRRAHWHGFWKGPRKEVDKREMVVKWLPPIMVKGEEMGEKVVTVRRVKERDKK